jgi:predicted enzyme related to lactoylglutathione lyase
VARFFEYALRTTDVPGAQAFYAAVLGRCDADIVPLHEQALARGARPHWLGHVDVDDIDAAVAAFVARGATPLGPRWVDPRGLEAAVLRDPGGAIVSLARPGPALRPHGGARVPEVVWHELNTVDVERARTNYGDIFGWEMKSPVDLGHLGVIHPFSWRPGEAAAGSMSDIAQRKGVHSHWLFHFRVAALDVALESVRARGGLALDPLVLPSGDRIAVCDDVQGATFALFEASARAPR